MIDIVEGPRVSSPVVWNLVFQRSTGSWRMIGRYKHVRAYGYVPFLHVWQFVDVGLSGFRVFVAADGAPVEDVLRVWLEGADVIAMRARAHPRRMPVLGFCVPAMKRLIGLRCVAMRPDAFYRQCLINGGIPFEAEHGGRPAVSAAGDGPDVRAVAAAIPAGHE